MVRPITRAVAASANSTRGGATVESAPERARALRRRAVGERLGLDVAGRAALDRVVADLRCRVERLVDVADLDQAARVGRLAPRAGETVRLELDRDRADLVAAQQVPQVLYVMADLVRDHVRLCEIARRAEAAPQLVVETQIDIDLVVELAIERPDRSRGSAARRANRVAEQDEPRVLVAGQLVAPGAVDVVEHEADEVLELALALPRRRRLLLDRAVARARAGAQIAAVHQATHDHEPDQNALPPQSTPHA